MAGLPLLLCLITLETRRSAFQQLLTSSRPFSHPPAAESRCGSPLGPPAPGGAGASGSPPGAEGAWRESDGGYRRCAQRGREGAGVGSRPPHAPQFSSPQPNAIPRGGKANWGLKGEKN